MNSYNTTTPNGESLSFELPSNLKARPFAVICHGRDDTKKPVVSSTHARKDLALKESKGWFTSPSNKGIRLTIGVLV